MTDNTIDYTALGQRVKKIRKERGIRQTELADTLGISYQYMSMIETLEILWELIASLSAASW